MRYKINESALIPNRLDPAKARIHEMINYPDRAMYSRIASLVNRLQGIEVTETQIASYVKSRFIRIDGLMGNQRGKGGTQPAKNKSMKLNPVLSRAWV